MARPTKITPEQMEPYFEGVRLGMSVERAAYLGGTSHDLVAKARSFPWFVEAEKRAQSECIRRRLERIDRAGEGGLVFARKTTIKTNAKTGDTTEVIEESLTPPQWQADGWTLERRFREDFAKDKEPSKSDEEIALITRTVQALMAAKQ